MRLFVEIRVIRGSQVGPVPTGRCDVSRPVGTGPTATELNLIVERADAGTRRVIAESVSLRIKQNSQFTVGRLRGARRPRCWGG